MQKALEIMAIDKLTDKTFVTVSSGTIEFQTDLTPPGFNENDFVIVQTLTGTDAPAVFNAHYEIVRK